jgi:hypothetical protein
VSEVVTAVAASQMVDASTLDLQEDITEVSIFTAGATWVYGSPKELTLAWFQSDSISRHK